MITSERSRERVNNARLLDELEGAWQRTDDIFAIVKTASLRQRPIDLRHPLTFYVGHLPAFTWNMLGRGVLERGPLNAEFDTLFDFGIDPDDDEAPTEAIDWPALDRIEAYRDRVRDFVRGAGDDVADRSGAHLLAENGRIFHVVLEHELMHHETLLYMLQELGPEHKLAPAWWSEPRTGAAADGARRAAIDAGPVTLGADFDALDFGWDNEFPQRSAQVEAFELATLPVTNAEYRAFVDAGGYEARELWEERGWDWTRRRDCRRPKDWTERDGKWLVRTMFEPVPFEAAAHWPVQVSHAEARAYARFHGARLPTEAELHRAAYGADGTDASAKRGNFDLRHHAPTPVGSFADGATSDGVQELFGNGWDWTATPFEAHAGFEDYMEGYRGYSKDFFDGDHFVLFGGSWAASKRLMRRSFRNWFRFNYPYPFTQFRLAWGDGVR